MASDVISQIYNAMKFYTKEVDEKAAKAAQKAAKQCAKELNAASAVFPYRGRTKVPYSKSWISTKEQWGYVVHSKLPGIPHVLERGHAVVRNGKVIGRAAAHPHIAPVVEKNKSDYETAIRKALE